MSSVYIHPTGAILPRGGRSSNQTISLLVKLVLLIVLWLTNPANNNVYTERFIDNISKSPGANVNVEQRTNYGIFALERTRSLNKKKFIFHGLNYRKRVVIGVISRWLPICEYTNSDDDKKQNFRKMIPQTACRWIGENLIHNLEFMHPSYRAYTVTRIVSMVLGLSSLFTSRESWSRFSRRRNNNLFHTLIISLISVFREPALIQDLFILSQIVYSPLLLMEKAVNVGTLSLYNNNDAAIHFYMSVAVIFLFIGGLVNYITSRIISKDVYGLKGTYAVLLGYQTVVSPASILIHSDFLDANFTAADVLLGITIIQLSSLGRSLSKRSPSWLARYFIRPASSPISLVIGGIAGAAVGRYHVERYNLLFQLYANSR